MSQTQRSPRRIAIIQARVSSTRFPGKVLEPLLDLPLIVFMAVRVRQAKLVDEVWVATSTHPSDDPLSQTLADHGIPCYRGSLDDVLDRFYQTALAAKADHIVRLTGDCPLMDADLVDRALEVLQTSDADYVSNIEPPSFADGLDVEAFTLSALKDAWQNAQRAAEREHVTLYLRAGNPHIKTSNWVGIADLSALRWTIDHQDDLDHVKALLHKIGAVSATGFDRFDLYRSIERAGLGAGARHTRNEGLAKSLAAEIPMPHSQTVSR